MSRRASGIVAACLTLLALSSCGRTGDSPAPPAAIVPATPDSTPARVPDSTVAAPAYDFDRLVGVARWSDEVHLCLQIDNPSLAPGDLVTLVSPLARAYAAVARVVGAASDSCGGRDSSATTSVYALRILRGAIDSDDLAIAIVGTATTPRLSEGVMSADLDGDGRMETFHECASHEGIHLTLWTGSPRTGQRRWHRYVHMGIDLEANCTEDEVARAPASGP